MIEVSGKGVHGGQQCTVRIHREAGPVTFLRASTRIPADASALAGTDRATSLKKADRTVSMVEHLLAALHVTGWWQDLLVEVSAEELPVLDGSATDWLPVLESLGTPPPPPEAIRIPHAVSVSAGGATASILPGPQALDVTINFPHPRIGTMNWRGGPSDYSQLVDARTFGFLEDLERLRQAGLGLGADLSNCLVYSSDGTLNSPRGSDEPVRHKALDVLGDLYLLGQPVDGTVVTSCSSHALHARLVQEIRQHAGMETAS